MSQNVVDAFVRFGKKMIDHFSDRVKYWIGLNEQNVFVGLGYRDGHFPCYICDDVYIFINRIKIGVKQETTSP